MDEVFLSQPDLTDQPIGIPDVDYFTDANRMAHTLQVCSGDFELIH
jgi:hypothetical protein